MSVFTDNKAQASFRYGAIKTPNEDDTSIRVVTRELFRLKTIAECALSVAVNRSKLLSYDNVGESSASYMKDALDLEAVLNELKLSVFDYDKMKFVNK